LCGSPDVGDTVTYSYLVTNTSNVTLSNVKVVDDNGTPDTGDDFTITIGTLARRPTEGVPPTAYAARETRGPNQ
jgi:hypothetical protein